MTRPEYVDHLEHVIRGAQLLVWNVQKDIAAYLQTGDTDALERALINAQGEDQYLTDQITRLHIGHRALGRA
jgi:hypothetical protein